MHTSSLTASLSASLLVVLFTAGCKGDVRKEAPVTSATSPEIAANEEKLGAPAEGVVAEFHKRIDEYISLQKELDGTLTKLPDRATPQQIDTHQRALAALVAKARTDAKVGDIFLPGMQAFVRATMRRVLAASDGARIKASLMDENPMGVKLAVNGRYPDTVPLSTMPPDVLAALPPLPEDLEYRFVGNRLILLDTRAHVIVDLVPNVFEL